MLPIHFDEYSPNYIHKHLKVNSKKFADFFHHFSSSKSFIYVLLN